MATSFGHNGYHQAISQELKKSWHILCKIVNLYGIAFTDILMYLLAAIKVLTALKCAIYSTGVLISP